MTNTNELKFMPKVIVATSGVEAKLKENQEFSKEIEGCLIRHFKNEGDECASDRRMNELAIKHMDGRVLSVFNNCAGSKIYIITDGLHLRDSYNEYPLTTILFPDEY